MDLDVLITKYRHKLCAYNEELKQKIKEAEESVGEYAVKVLLLKAERLGVLRALKMINPLRRHTDDYKLGREQLESHYGMLLKMKKNLEA